MGEFLRPTFQFPSNRLPKNLSLISYANAKKSIYSQANSKSTTISLINKWFLKRFGLVLAQIKKLSPAGSRTRALGFTQFNHRLIVH